MARGSNFKKFNSDNREITLLQANVEAAISALTNSALLAGIPLEGVELGSGNNTIEHRLGRAVRGYLVTARSAYSELYDNINSGEELSKNFILNSSAPITVNLWVF